MVKISRFIYLVAAWLFVIGVVGQVFIVGMIVVAVKWSWDPHILLGHSLALPLLIMLVTMYLGRLPSPMKPLTWLLFGAYFIQADVIIFLRGAAPVISAFHPVFALVDFALGLNLARRAWSLVRQVQGPDLVAPVMERSTNQ